VEDFPAIKEDQTIVNLNFPMKAS